MLLFLYPSSPCSGNPGAGDIPLRHAADSDDQTCQPRSLPKPSPRTRAGLFAHSTQRRHTAGHQKDTAPVWGWDWLGTHGGPPREQLSSESTAIPMHFGSPEVIHGYDLVGFGLRCWISYQHLRIRLHTKSVFSAPFGTSKNTGLTFSAGYKGLEEISLLHWDKHL